MKMPRHLPTDLTTFDFLKVAALVLMVIDHIGFYLLTPTLPMMPGDPILWWRVIGRWCVPIWFFLIGYATTRDIPPMLWAMAGVVAASCIVTGMFVFPLNVLATMIIIRLIINSVARLTFGSIEGAAAIIVLMIITFLLSQALTEYGTAGLLMALMGYAVRHAGEGGQGIILTKPLYRRLFLVVAGGLSMVAQLMLFPFVGAQIVAMAVGMAAVMGFLCYMRPTTYPMLTSRLPQTLVAIIKLGGRHTAEFYALHLVAFRVAATVFGLGFPIYGWFDWDWTLVGAFTPR